MHLALCETSGTGRQGDGAIRRLDVLVAPSPPVAPSPRSYLLLSACRIAISASGAMIL
jgi:hypothetical protein